MLNIHQSLLFVILLIKKPSPRQTGLIPRDDPWGGMKVDQGGRSTGRQGKGHKRSLSPASGPPAITRAGCAALTPRSQRVPTLGSSRPEPQHHPASSFQGSEVVVASTKLLDAHGLIARALSDQTAE